MVVRNHELEVIAETVTDPVNGMVNINLNGCRDVIQIDFVGGPKSTYFDESSNRVEAFPEGEVLRVRLPSLAKNFTVSAFTEAAERLMDAEAGGSLNPLNSTTVELANARIAKVVTDQVPGFFRRTPSGEIGIIDITRIAKPANKDNLNTKGTFKNTPNGQYGAVIAGLGALGVTFDGAGDRPASRIGCDHRDPRG